VSEHDKTPASRLADVFIYAPIGLATEVLETFPRLVNRGRERVRFVRLVGQVVVAKGQQKFAGVFEHVFESGAQSATDGDEPTPNVALPDIEDDDVEQPIVVRHLRSAYDLDEAALLAIPDYDSLAASQVVPRLAGLTADELEAVRAYEAAHRARRTILGRVAQLQQSA
jgi:hypothetical protein